MPQNGEIRLARCCQAPRWSGRSPRRPRRFAFPSTRGRSQARCRRRTESTRLSLRPTCSDCVRHGRSGRPPHSGNGSPRSWSFFLPFYASRQKASSPVVRVLPPLTPRRRISGSPSSCASTQSASTSTERHRQVSKLPVSEFEQTLHESGREL